MKRIAVFASGRGSDFQSIVDHVNLGVLLNAEISLLVCNHEDAPVIQRAKENEIPVFVRQGVSGQKFADGAEREKAREEFDNEVIEKTTKEAPIDYIALAGFDKVLSSGMVSAFQNRIVNIHPAYDLVKYGGRGMVGAKVHESVIRSAEKYSGATVHFVDNSVDGGPVLLKQKVRVRPNDTSEVLAQRVLVYEHRLYPKALQLLVDGRVKLVGIRAYVDLYSGGWDLKWDGRQQKYIDYQTGAWERAGVSLEDLL